MLWLIITIFVYFLFALTSLIDKYLLKPRILHPKIYTFYVGILGILVLFLIPLGFFIPDPKDIFLSLFVGAISTLALFGFFSGLQSFEASRFIPAFGGFLPIFTFSLGFLFFREVFFDPLKLISFFLLISGTILIILRREKQISKRIFKIVIPIAFLFSLFSVLAKLVFLKLPFWPGFIWMRIGAFLAVLPFFFSKQVREELTKKRVIFKGKTEFIFLFNQGLGAVAVILQNFALALVPIALLAFINALQGVQYVFLFILTIFFSLKFPQILKEEISKKILIQKLFAILFIGLGFIFLAMK